MGYDGKGQVRVKTPAELAAAWGFRRPGTLRAGEDAALQLECSVIWRAARMAPWCTCPCSATCTAMAFWR